METFRTSNEKTILDRLDRNLIKYTNLSIMTSEPSNPFPGWNEMVQQIRATPYGPEFLQEVERQNETFRNETQTELNERVQRLEQRYTAEKATEQAVHDQLVQELQARIIQLEQSPLVGDRSTSKKSNEPVDLTKAPTPLTDLPKNQWAEALSQAANSGGRKTADLVKPATYKGERENNRTKRWAEEVEAYWRTVDLLEPNR